MTVIRPNSVSGINSITAQADEIKVFKSNGTQGGLIIGGANLNATTGISTILALNVTGNVSIAGTLTYQDVTNVDSVGIITARSTIDAQGDVSIADKIVHTGDTNTAIRFPAADTVTVETAGSERLRITSGGEVSIGGFTPTAGAGILQIGGGLRVAGSGSASDTTTPYIYRTSGVDNLNFATSGVERLRITSAGVIETGTAVGGSGYDSNMVFRIGRAGDCNLAIRNTANTTSHTGIDFGDSGDDRSGRIQYMHNGDYMSFHTNGAGSGSSNERLRIDSSGVLKIERGSATDFALRIDTTSSTGACRISFDESGTSKGQIAYSHGNDQVELVGLSGNKAAIITNGNKTGFIQDTNGYITKPLNPKFWAKSSNAQTLNSNSSNVIKNYENEIYDIGNCYDGTNKFTAPITGYYHFGWSFMIQGSNADTFTYLFGAPLISGNDIQQEVMSPRSGGALYVSVVGSHLLYLTSGQYVQIRMRQSGGSNVSVRADQSYFWGYLVG